MTAQKRSPHAAIAALVSFLSGYVTLENEMDYVVLALWAIMTHVFRRFDAIPYLVITSSTKQSGKTRLAELLSLAADKSRMAASVTPGVLFTLMSEGATVFFDEAEELNSETSPLRATLNIGYRAGQTIPRRQGFGIIDYDVYGPKVFILIGDVYDTLRDRSIIIDMVRRPAKRFFRWADAKAESAAFQPLIASAITALGDGDLWPESDMTYLPSRDAEVWTSIIALAERLCPEYVPALRARARDLAELKKREAKIYTKSAQAESDQDDKDYAALLVRDLAALVGTHRHLLTNDVIGKLKAIETSPWRAYRGEGLNAMTMAHLLKPTRLQPRAIKVSGKTLRGYRAEDIRAAASKIGQ